MKTILAYSGGLDTSIILHWLTQHDHHVTCYVADIGQKEEHQEIKDKAKKLGAEKVIIQDLKEKLIKKFYHPALQANALYQNKYLLGTAIARPLIAKEMIKTAKKEHIKNLAHGATGKGNDQIRFELAFKKLMPEANIIAPWKNEKFLKKFKGRKDLIKYAEKHEIEYDEKVTYSIDENLLHTSYEGDKIENINHYPNEQVFKKTTKPQNAPDKTVNIEIKFSHGKPVQIKTEKETVKDPVEIIEKLNQIGGENAIGRTDLIEDRIIGIKSRGIYEAPAATILLKAHQELEQLTLDKEQLRIKNQLEQKITEKIYAGEWFTPEMEIMQKSILQTQEKVNGTITLELYKGNMKVVKRKSKDKMYNQGKSSMDKLVIDPTDSKGYINTKALRYQK